MESIQGSGRFSVRNSFGITFTGSVPKEVMPALLALRVGEACRGIVLETTTENFVTGDVKRTYELKSIEPTEASPKSEVGQLTLPF